MVLSSVALGSGTIIYYLDGLPHPWSLYWMVPSLVPLGSGKTFHHLDELTYEAFGRHLLRLLP
jgi:hypothetical protein